MPKISGWSRKQKFETTGSAMPFVWEEDNGSRYVVIQRTVNPRSYRSLVLTRSELVDYYNELESANQVTRSVDNRVLGKVPKYRPKNLYQKEMPVVNGEAREIIRDRTTDWLEKN